jgi:hypothetical protein
LKAVEERPQIALLAASDEVFLKHRVEINEIIDKLVSDSAENRTESSRERSGRNPKPLKVPKTIQQAAEMRWVAPDFV